MEDYQRKAIASGEAIDVYAEPEKLREAIMRDWGYLETVDGFKELVEQIINQRRQKGVSYWLDMNIHHLQVFLPLVPRYIKKCLDVKP